MEAIRNADLPSIGIYYSSSEAEQLARAVGHGIEEEGLPYEIIRKRLDGSEAYELTKRPGLGVIVVVAEGGAAVYTRQLKQQVPLFDLSVAEMKTAAAIGKNAARIVKRKPFLDLE